MPEAEDFREALHTMFKIAEKQGKPSITITSGELHRRVGGYPSRNHRMPTCCSVLTQELTASDKILYEPPSGKGATLKIRYNLPRQPS